MIRAITAEIPLPGGSHSHPILWITSGPPPARPCKTIGRQVGAHWEGIGVEGGDVGEEWGGVLTGINKINPIFLVRELVVPGARSGVLR